MSLPRQAESSSGLHASDRRALIVRRLFSLSGVLPLSAFVIFHLATELRVLGGREAFDAGLTTVSKARLLGAVIVLGVPLVFHAAYGIALGVRARPNLIRYPFAANWAYTLQRASGLLVLAFVTWHVYELRVRVWQGQIAPSDFHSALCASLSSTGAGGIPFAALGYLLGVAATAYHLANGLNGFCMTWGLVRSQRAARRLGLVFGAVGLVVFAAGALTVLHFATGGFALARAG